MTQADGAGYGRESHLGPCAAAWLLKRCPLRSLTQAKPLLSARRELSGSHGSGGHRGRAGRGQPSHLGPPPRSAPAEGQPGKNSGNEERRGPPGSRPGPRTERKEATSERARGAARTSSAMACARAGAPRGPPLRHAGVPAARTQLGLRGQALRRAVDVLTDRHCTVRVDKERREATGRTRVAGNVVTPRPLSTGGRAARGHPHCRGPRMAACPHSSALTSGFSAKSGRPS